MIVDTDRPAYETHAVTNQPPPLESYNLFEQDAALGEALAREGGGWAEAQISELGKWAGTPDAIRLGFDANENPPVLHTHDRFGNRIDEVQYHPAWHALMSKAVGEAVHSLPWIERKAGSHVARAALMNLMSQVEAGHGCPISMSYAGVAALTAQPEIAEEWIPRVTTRHYDSRFIPAAGKRGAIMGMAMTEKQGGSDVRSNTTKAEAVGIGGPGGEYLLTGHKWFCSAPMSDIFLTLAHTENGLSCFIIPRWLPDGTLNRIRIQRLKNKLGNRSNASSEIEFLDAWAQMVGEDGRGVRTIIEMVQHTRLDCVIGCAAIMRQALAQAAHHAAHRSAFGKLLSEQPLMQNVLADLAVESEAATMLMMRLARAYDSDEGDSEQRAFARLATAVGKYWVCKRCPGAIGEALECHGGAGYVEESILPRLYREAPVNSIWEGSGNVMCLDVLRAMKREPESVEAFMAELAEARGADKRLDAAIDQLGDELARTEDVELRARTIVQKMALALQGSLMARHGDEAVREAFFASRFCGATGHAYGSLPAGLDLRAIVERTTPRTGAS